MGCEAPPFDSSPESFHFVFSFLAEIHNQKLLAPLTANQPTSATNPEHSSAVANNTKSARRIVSGRFNSALTSTPEKPNTMTIATSAMRLAPGKTISDVPNPGRRQSAATATTAATPTNTTLENSLARRTESISLGTFLFS